jgi:hypothetical protein
MKQKSSTSLRGAFGAISQMNARRCDEDDGNNYSFILLNIKSSILATTSK